MNLSVIDPYELFGLDPQTVTLKELKRKYYEFALLVHPDKNHGLDGRDMHVVHSAYKYCERELLHTASKETSVEALTDAFAAFCKTQEDAPPPFRDIMEDALDMKRFHSAFESHVEEEDSPGEVFRASFAGGYGEHMDASSSAASLATLATLATQKQDTEEMQQDLARTKLRHDFSTCRAVTRYQEPAATVPRAHELLFDYELKQEPTNYTAHVRRVCLTDYKEAHSGVVDDFTFEAELGSASLHALAEKRQRENAAYDKMIATKLNKPLLSLDYHTPS
jgi:hypothetical protein